MKHIDIKSKKRKLKKIIGKFKNYKTFSSNKDKAYAYTKAIGIKVCPYCNINYVYTVFTKNKLHVLRPDLDHFEPKSTAKGKSLDPENLIPSCQTCNSRLKGAKTFTRATHIHPYFDDFNSIKRIGVSLSKANYMNENNFEILFYKHNKAKPNDSQRADRNIEDFKLKDRYQHHKNEVVEIFHKIKFYHQAKRKEINELIGESVSLQQILFSDATCDINKTSLGKLKRDIIQKYK